MGILGVKIKTSESRTLDHHAMVRVCICSVGPAYWLVGVPLNLKLASNISKLRLYIFVVVVVIFELTV